MANPNAINTIALSLRSSKIKVVTMVLEILGAVCLIHNGHKRVLECTAPVPHTSNTKYVHSNGKL